MTRLTRFLACASILAAMLVPAGSAEAHHFFTTCNEVGVWSRTAITNFYFNSGNTAGLAKRMEGWFSVNNIPVNGNGCAFATQHNSAHALRGGTNPQCIETVAQRFNSGVITMWGYDCGYGYDTPYYNHNVVNYGADNMYFVMDNSNEDYRWDHWYYRADTGTWHLIDWTPTAYKGFWSWLESSGYNDGATRGMLMQNYRVTSFGAGSWYDGLPCPETNDFDQHQEMLYTNIPSGTSWFWPDGGNACN